MCQTEKLSLQINYTRWSQHQTESGRGFPGFLTPTQKVLTPLGTQVVSRGWNSLVTGTGSLNDDSSKLCTKIF